VPRKRGGVAPAHECIHTQPGTYITVQPRQGVYKLERHMEEEQRAL
jgi:hypothetical protein